MNMGLFDTVRLDPNRDPDAERCLRNTWSKDHEHPAGRGAKTGKDRPKRLYWLVRKFGPTFVISRSPVQVRPVAPLKKPLIFLRKSRVFPFREQPIFDRFPGFWRPFGVRARIFLFFGVPKPAFSEAERPRYIRWPSACSLR